MAIIAILISITLFSALIRQTMRADRAERRLELAYAVARVMKRDDFADYLAGGEPS
uniref:hypothetical protein n=1 Tax=Sphingomonas populi TaxID=2484750 RepID=UPI0013EE6B25|nr:hypothetical protein [Sphingomonas populi]